MENRSETRNVADMFFSFKSWWFIFGTGSPGFWNINLFVDRHLLLDVHCSIQFTNMACMTGALLPHRSNEVGLSKAHFYEHSKVYSGARPWIQRSLNYYWPRVKRCLSLLQDWTVFMQAECQKANYNSSTRVWSLILNRVFVFNVSGIGVLAPVMLAWWIYEHVSYLRTWTPHRASIFPVKY